VRFFKTVIMPLLPREAKLSIDRDGVIQWRSLIGAGGDDAGPTLQIEDGDKAGKG
jgi:hypothetical protein